MVGTRSSGQDALISSGCRTSSFSATFFFNDTATTEIYTLSLHDALPISITNGANLLTFANAGAASVSDVIGNGTGRSEVHAADPLSLSETASYTVVTSINSDFVSLATIGNVVVAGNFGQ